MSGLMGETRDLWVLVHDWKSHAQQQSSGDPFCDGMAHARECCSDELKEALDGSDLVNRSRLDAVERELGRATESRDEYHRAMAGALDALEREIATNRELLAALKLARSEFGGLPHSLGYDFTHIPKIDAAIAKAEAA